MPDHGLAADAAWRDLLTAICGALGIAEPTAGRLRVTGTANLPSAFPVTDLAVAAIGAAALAVSDLVGLGTRAPDVVVDRRLASVWFGWSIRPDGWQVPPAWDPVAGDYAARDGWIKLHTN